MKFENNKCFLLEAMALNTFIEQDSPAKHESFSSFLVCTNFSIVCTYFWLA